MHIKPPIPRMNSPNYKQRIIRKDCVSASDKMKENAEEKM